MIISIQFLCLFSFIYCAADTITLNKRGCLYLDKISSNEEIISFEYIEGYYRAIHANYAITKSSSVKMKYLGDSTSDIFIECIVSPNYREIAVGGGNEKYHYHIPCYIQQPSELKEGTYCIEIVKTLVGDINSEDFCSDLDTFKVIKSTNLPNLNVVGFSSEQQGCVQMGDKVTLLATVKNQVSEYQEYTNLGIGLSNTETVANNIALSCKIEGGISVNSQEKIICIIPSSLSSGVYTILYSNDLLDNYKCPVNVINNFNSINFGGELKKLRVFQSNSINIKAYLENITVSDSLNSLNSFNLAYTLDNIQNNGNLLFENINQIDIGIKLIDKTGSIVRTKCSLINKDLKFDLNCKVESYYKNTKYSILIEDDITIGYDKNEKLCTQGSSIVYEKIVIPAGEYNFFIIFNDDESTSLDCNQKQYGFSNYEIQNARNICGSCTPNCLFCGNNCIKCMDGFELTSSSKCNLIKDRIDYSKFFHLKEFSPFEDSCFNNDKNERKLFTFQFSYIVNKGENLAFQSEDNYDSVFAKNENNNQYGLNCHVDVNPAYDESDQNYGICRESSCELNGYVNCSFKEKPQNGKYNIIGDTNGNLGKLIEKGKVEYGQSIEIKFITNKIKGNVSGDKIQIVYQGYSGYHEKVYVCTSSNDEVGEYYGLSSCTRISYDKNNDESILECSSTINNYYQKDCIEFKGIMILNECDEYIKDEFDYNYCPESNSSRTIFINLLKIFLISIFLI